MFQESNRWIVLGVALLLAACGTEQVGEGAADNTPGNTQDVGTETTDGETQTDDASQNDTKLPISLTRFIPNLSNSFLTKLDTGS